MNINKRLLRWVGLLAVVFLLAPIEDGCRYDKAAASGTQKIAAYAARSAFSLTKGIR